MKNDAPLLETKRLLLTNGKHLRIARLGHGPPIVLLHGYPENLQVWSKLAPLLVDRFEVIAFDWPGMGYSDEWPGGATPQLLAKRLFTIFDELKLSRPTVLGMDMGGQPALAFAAMYPDRIQQLIVMNSLVFGDEQTSWEIRWLRKFGFNRFALRTLPGVIFRRAVRTFLPRDTRLGDRLRSDFWTAFESSAVRKFISKMCAGYQGMLDQLPELYDTIRCPTLVLWAEHDKHFPLIQGARLHQTISGSTFNMVPGATHWMPLTHAQELADAIKGLDIDNVECATHG
jgi:pimeloyl-ACP methyl ester carboxylesterase